MRDAFDGPVPALPADPMAQGAGHVVAALQQSGFTAYMAGGCVRDLLLGLTPRDYDIATDASPDTVMSLFPESDAVGRAFGVVLVRRGGLQFEVATFRSDRDYRDGRHPESVVFSSPREDAERRDFTINAMFFDPAKRTILDYTGGQADLTGRVIRCVGDPGKRFAEDHLRMLRAIRFAGTLSFRLDPDTADAIRRLAENVTRISPERVRDELSRMLTESRRPGDTLRLAHELGLLMHVLPEVTAMKGQSQPPEYHPEGDVFEHTVLMLNTMSPRPDPALAFAVLLHDVGKPPVVTEENGRLRFNCHAETGAVMAEEILRRLRFSARETETVVTCVRHHMQFRDAVNMKRATLRRLIGRPTFPVEIELHRLDCLSSHRKLENYEYLREAEKQFVAESPLPPRWVTGKDLIALGVQPGPAMGRLLREAYDAQIGGRFDSRETTLEWLRKSIAEEPPSETSP
jgi:poly(A) polymerase